MALKSSVTLDGHDAPVEVTITNPDRVRWDMTRSKHNWPTFNDAPFLGTTFLAWAALRREGIYTGTFEDFRDRDAVDVQSYEDTTDEADAVGDLGNPTP